MMFSFGADLDHVNLWQAVDGIWPSFGQHPAGSRPDVT
jgi:hypothetical protein